MGVLKAFIQPCHSHKKGKAGLGLGTVVTLNEDVEVGGEVADVDEVELFDFGDSGDKEEDELPLT